MKIEADQSKKNEEKMQLIGFSLDKISDAVFWARSDGQFFYVNKAACSLLEYSEEELLSMKVYDVDPTVSKENWPEKFERIRQKGSLTLQSVHHTKSGRIFPVEITVNNMNYEGNEYHCTIVRDISERKKTEEALIAARQAAEDTDRNKSEFLATMSHELRTPLNSIIGFSDLMLQKIPGDLNEKQIDYIDHISKSSKHLLQLINDILDFSKIEAGKMELYYQQFYIYDAVEEVRLTLAPLAAKKDVIIETEIGIDSELVINADRTKFRQILYNLISNAIKFTPAKGLISICVRHADNTIQLSIKDTGIGICEENISKLFQPFKQLNQHSAHENKGTGLGLAIVKKYVELHGGDIRVQSKPGEGSTFEFVIPVNPK